MLEDSHALEEAGAFALVLEVVPSPLARLITQQLKIPTIGIGAGPDCDGQVQVLHDMLGMYTGFVPKHIKRYASLADTVETAISQYAQEVKEGSFPAEEHSFSMDESLLEGLTDPR